MRIPALRSLLCWCSCTGLLCISASAQKPELVVQTGHSGQIRGLAFSPSGRTLASAGEDYSGSDYTIKLWDAANGRQLRTLAGHTYHVLSVAFSPDGRTLATGSADTTIRLWDVASGRQLRIFSGHRLEVKSVAFSPDGRILASGGDTIKLWDVPTGRTLRTLAEDDFEIQSIAFSPDGRSLAAASNTISCEIWDVASGRRLRILEEAPPNDTRFHYVAYSPDGRRLASRGARDTIKLWDVEAGSEFRSLDQSDIDSVAFSSDGRMLATGGWGGFSRIAVWEVASGRRLLALDENLSRTVAFSPDGHTLAAGSSDNSIKFWDVEARPLETHTDTAAAVAFSPDGRQIAVGYRDQSITLWDVAGGHELQTFQNDDDVRSITFSPDMRTLVVVGSVSLGFWDLATGHELRPPDDGRSSEDSNSDANSSAAGRLQTYKLWDMVTGKYVRTLTIGTDAVSIGMNALGNDNPVPLSPDGTLFVSEGEGIKLCDVVSGGKLRDLVRRNLLVANARERRTLAGRTAQVNLVASSPDGRSLASAMEAHGIQVWDLTSGKEPRSLAGKGFDPKTITYSPDGHTLAGTNGSKLQLWDTRDGSELRNLDAPTSYLNSLAFSPNGQTLALGGVKIRLWDVTKGLNLATLAGHVGKAKDDVTPSQTVTLIGPPDQKGRRLLQRGGVIKHVVMFEGDEPALVISLAISPNGGILASGSNDNTIKLWDLANGNEERTLAGHSAWVHSVAFNPDGLTLASGSDDFTVKLWDVRTGHEIRTLNGHTDRVMSVVFSPNGRSLASGSDDGTIRLWDAATGHALQTLPAHAAVLSVAFNPDGRTVATGDKHAIRFWDATTGNELAAVFALEGGAHWLVASPSGWFDTDNLDDIEGLSWVFPDEPLRALAPEIFMRDYYKPRLLPRLLDGKALPKVRALQELNRAQPQVDVLKVEPEARERLVSVTVQVTGTQSEVQKDKSGKLLQSGAYDLRLFRDGQLVGQWPEAAPSPQSVPGADEAKLEAWRKLHQIDLTGGRYTHTFSHLRLPQRPGTDKVQFTAYAFNSDRVKSQTTPPYAYKLPTAGSVLTVSRRAYLITMGVNANQSGWNLELAVSSAERARQLLHGNLQREYPEIVEIPLYSDLAETGVQVVSTRARKAHLEAVLDLLAGRLVEPALRDEVDRDHKLRPATPDDAVVLYVASHGYADPQGNFYLIPYDTGTRWGITEDVLGGCYGNLASAANCQQAADFLRHAVSSADLAAWWQGVDAGEMVMILDSCHSGAVPGKEFRPGPLGDAGFGQLSYDKGMQILCAAQPAQTEQGDWIGGGEGRTLLVEALDTVARKNPNQTLAEWLKAAEHQLPIRMRQLYPQIKEGDVQLPELLDFAKPAKHSAVSSADADKPE